MLSPPQDMEDIFEAEYVSLHVRKSNSAAFHLYTQVRVLHSRGGGVAS